MNKSELRHLLRNRRRQLDISAQESAAQKVAARLSEIIAFQQSKHVACYISIKGELNTKPIIEAIWQNHKTCYLPILDSHSYPQSSNNSNHKLCFVRYCKNDVLVNDRYGIPEPIMDNNVIIAPQDLDVVFVPLVAFDESGNRLGQGAGYYDRTFAFKLKSETGWTEAEGLAHKTHNKPVLIGLAYEWQKVSAIEVNSWDVPLQMIITDLRVYSSMSNPADMV